MAYIKDYWINKESRAERAAKWTERMEKEYAEEIKMSSDNTTVFSQDEYENNFSFSKLVYPRHPRVPDIVVSDMDVTDAIKEEYEKEKGKRIAVLNFASYKNPGGMFLNGSKAQEESLCHKSYLYNVLKRQTEFYKWNRMHLNRGLYKDRLLYTPNVIFFDDEVPKAKCDVITCAAPNKSVAQKYQNVSYRENWSILFGRIETVLREAERNRVEILILGAYGCGVFGQDPKETAEIFNILLTEKAYSFKKAVFPIPKTDRDRNYEIFKEVFAKGGSR